MTIPETDLALRERHERVVRSWLSYPRTAASSQAASFSTANLSIERTFVSSRRSSELGVVIHC